MNVSRATMALRREPGPLVRSLTALVLRVALGSILLGAGLEKYQDMNRPAAAAPGVVVVEEAPASGGEELGAGSPPAEATAPVVEETRYPETIKGMFAGTFLAKRMPWALDVFTEVLPYAEMGLGAALIVGFWTPLAAFLAGILLVKLLLGWVILGEAEMYPNMLTYLIVDAAILWLSPVTSNYISLDGLLFGWFWRPRVEGTFVEEPPDAVPLVPRVERRR